MPKFEYLNIEEFRRLCFDFAQAQLSLNEPIPAYETADEEEVESILEQPKQTFDKKPLYKTLEDKAAILFYLFIKNHVFENGNKRVALVAIIVFLAVNGKWLKTDSRKVYLLALDVAKSKPEEKDEVMEMITNFIRKNITDTKPEK